MESFLTGWTKGRAEMTGITGDLDLRWRNRIKRGGVRGVS